MSAQKYKFMLGVIVALIFCVNAQAQAVVSKKQVTNILFISETHGANGSSIVWKASKDLLAHSINPAFQMGNYGITQTTFPSASQALNTIQSAATVLLEGYVSAVSEYLRNNGYDSAKVDWYYVFIDAGDNNEKKKVYIPLVINADGKIKNLGARVLASTPKILYYIYKSKGTEDNLPEEWSYPDGGVLYEYVLDQNFNIISSSTVNTGGKYDPPATPEGDSILDPDSGLSLLINEVIVRRMIDKAALFSIVDYARRVEPLYECNENGDCVAVMSIESLTRSISMREICTGPNDPLGGTTYRNTGKIGYTLRYQFERYLVEPAGNYYLTAMSEGYTVSPTLDFDKSMSNVSLPSDDYIIDPLGKNVLYDFKNDTVNGQPCDRYIYAGTRCAQAPISTILPAVTWSFTAPSPEGNYSFYNSDLGNGHVRWRIFRPNGQCIRFDTLMEIPYTIYSYEGFTQIVASRNTISFHAIGQNTDEYNNSGEFVSSSITLNGATASGSIPLNICSLSKIVASGNRLDFYSKGYIGYSTVYFPSYGYSHLPTCKDTSKEYLLGSITFEGTTVSGVVSFGSCSLSSILVSSRDKLIFGSMSMASQCSITFSNKVLLLRKVPGGIQMFRSCGHRCGTVYQHDGTIICRGKTDFNEYPPLTFGHARGGLFMYRSDASSLGYGVKTCKYSCYQLCGGNLFNEMKATYRSWWNYYQNW